MVGLWEEMNLEMRLGRHSGTRSQRAVLLSLAIFPFEDVVGMKLEGGRNRRVEIERNTL